MHQIKNTAPVLEVNNLKVEFNCGSHIVHAVNGVSLKVFPGKISAIVGESGCGKSVTAYAIMNLVDTPGEIVDGEIILSGMNFLKLPRRVQRKTLGSSIGMIFQDPFESLNPRMKIGDMIIEAVRANKKISGKAANSAARELLHRMHLSDVDVLMNRYPHQLSGGMCQRVMIAMAMAQKPPLLMADEPTTALDVTVQARIMDEIVSLRDNNNTGILFITHDLGVVAEIADDMYVMKDGRIVEYGEVTQIFDNPSHEYTKELLQSILYV
jgi:ABC-type dipeptide/oligopeptide/nickel transport system ATPase component